MARLQDRTRRWSHARPEHADRQWAEDGPQKRGRGHGARLARQYGRQGRSDRWQHDDVAAESFAEVRASVINGAHCDPGPFLAFFVARPLVCFKWCCGACGTGMATSSRIRDADMGNVAVTIRSFAGEVLLGPIEKPRSTPAESLKQYLRNARPGNGVRLLHGTRELMDHETLAVASPAADGALDLSAVMTKTYSVVAWGEETYGGRVCSGAETGILKLFSSSGAFAVIKEGGAVSAWGHPAYGGDVGAASRQLTSGVVSICAGKNAFVALKDDGSAVPWGNARFGGKPRGIVAKQLARGIASVESSGEAFAALTVTGAVVTWGVDGFGGDSSAVSEELASGVVTLCKTNSAFAALKEQGGVVTWGHVQNGGNSLVVAGQLSSGVTRIFSNATAFAALTQGGRVVVWGNPSCGGSAGGVMEQLASDVTTIYNSGSAFAAVKADGEVITWGQAGEPTIAAEHLARGGAAVQSNGFAVALALEGGAVETRGDGRSGGDSSKVAKELASGVTALFSTAGAFAALKEGGSVVTWGRGQPTNHGGDSSTVADALACGIVAIRNTQSAFAALKDIRKQAA